MTAFDEMDDDEAFDEIIRHMAAERGVSVAAMEEAIVGAAQSWAHSQPWWRRWWWHVKERFERGNE